MGAERSEETEYCRKLFRFQVPTPASMNVTVVWDVARRIIC